MTNLELSFVMAERFGYDDRERINLLATYNKQRPEHPKPPMQKKVNRSAVGRSLNRSIDISKTWSTTSRMEKGLSPLGVTGLIR